MVNLHILKNCPCRNLDEIGWRVLIDYAVVQQRASVVKLPHPESNDDVIDKCAKADEKVMGKRLLIKMVPKTVQER